MTEPPAADEPSARSTDTRSRKEGAAEVPARARRLSRLQLSVRTTILLLLLLSAVIRFVRLDQPKALVFDETYYAKDGCIYLHLSQQTCELKQDFEQSYVHPPTAKWLIAAGIKVFGYNTFGYRFTAAVFGVLLTLLVYLLAERLFHNRWISTVSGFLIATDFLMIVQSRTAMLDIFLAVFVVLGYLFVAMDREQVLEIRRHILGGAEGPPPARGWRNRLLAGVSMGLALSVKWSAIYALIAAALLCMSWSMGLHDARRRTEETPAGGTVLKATTGLVAAGLAFGAIPIAVYLGSYIDFYGRLAQQQCTYVVPDKAQKRIFGEGFNGHTAGECMTGIGGMAMNMGDLHQRMADYHLTLKATHLYQSKAWSWPLILRPVAYYWDSKPAPGGGQNVAHISAMGNIVTWYAAILAGVWLVVRSVKKWRPETVLVAAWGAQYVPWLIVARPLFFFYMAPAVPFMMIGLATSLDALRRRSNRASVLAKGYLVVVAISVVLFLPVTTGIHIPYRVWQMLMWIPNFDCGALKCGWI